MSYSIKNGKLTEFTREFTSTGTTGTVSCTIREVTTPAEPSILWNDGVYVYFGENYPGEIPEGGKIKIEDYHQFVHKQRVTMEDLFKYEK